MSRPGACWMSWSLGSSVARRSTARCVSGMPVWKLALVFGSWVGAISIPVAAPVAAQEAGGRAAACTVASERRQTLESASGLLRAESWLAQDQPENALAAYRLAQRAAEEAGADREALRAEANALRIAVQLLPAEFADASTEADPSARTDADPAPSGQALASEIEQAYARYAGLKADPEAVRLRIHLGRTAHDLAGKRPSLVGVDVLAAHAWQEAAEVAGTIGDTRQHSYALGYRGELYRERGHFEEALVLMDRALFAAQQANALEATARWQGHRAQLLLELGREADALIAFRDAIASLGRLRVESGSLFISDVGDQALYLSLVDLLLRSASREEDPARVQSLLGEARDVVEDQKVAELRDYFSDPCLEARRETALDSIAGAIVVYPVALPDRLELIVSGHGRLEHYRSPVGFEALNTEVHAFRRALQRRTSRQYLRHARQLYAWLIEPIEGLLAAEKPEVLVFVPGGSLRSIPFGALQRASDKKFLIERYPVAVIPSLSLIEPKAIDRADVRLLAAGLAVAVQGFPALPHVEQELDLLTQKFPGVTLRDEEFVISRFEREVKTVPYSIIHLASHGEFNGDPDESFLLTHDGKISMNDLSNWITATQFRAEEPLELLTLSACQTAIGNDRAALGLAGVALRAGARSVLATLWSVNDEATARLMDDFYERLGAPGISRAKALQLAQQNLIETKEYRHPAFWAPFLLLNDWH